MIHSHSTLREIAADFAIRPPLGAINPLGKGLINETFSLEAGGRLYVLQRINGAVFPRPEQIMENLRILSAHFAQREEPDLSLPALIPTRAGAAFFRDATGACWRMMTFIPDALTLTRIETPLQAHAVGAALGRFHRLAASLPIEQLGYSLPGFHATSAYLRHFLSVVESGTGQGCDEARDCINFVRRHQALADVLEDAREAGRIRLRVIHGDPKLDNILFTREGDRALALIDLDTVQPGLIQQDIGDCLRSCCNRSGEDRQDPEQVRFDLPTCEGILAGYADIAEGFLTGDDVALLYDSVRLLPFELGLRFLTDHLEGDRYFRVTERGRNLRKARIQFALLQDIERQEHMIRTLIDTAFKDVLSSPP